MMNNGNNWDHNVKGDAVKGPLQYVSTDDVVQMLDGIRAGKDLNIVVPIFRGKDDIMKCSCYRAVKLLLYEMYMDERFLEKGFV